jgi:CDP-2,3-bis-(O-geranylgeranyl)-sn-glycerol synthase
MRLVELVYLMLPAYFASMAALFAKSWPGWNRPISRRWRGDHMTVIGFLLGAVAGVVTSYIQSLIPWSPRGLDPSNWLAVGGAQDIGALGGDAAKSFIKHCIGIAGGHSWIPADRLIVGTMLLSWPWLRLRPLEVAVLLAFTFVARIVVNHIAFRLGIRDTER